MAQKTKLEIKLSMEETLEIRDMIYDFYQGLDTIQDYFFERKK